MASAISFQGESGTSKAAFESAPLAASCSRNLRVQQTALITCIAAAFTQLSRGYQLERSVNRFGRLS